MELTKLTQIGLFFIAFGVVVGLAPVQFIAGSGIGILGRLYRSAIDEGATPEQANAMVRRAQTFFGRALVALGTAIVVFQHISKSLGWR